MARLTKQEIRPLLPHGESMCLLESVEDWNDVTVRCFTRTHRDPRNPLRFKGRLTISAGLEYAAQAMGAHVGLLTDGRQTAHNIGLVGAVRDVVFASDRLDDLDGPLVVNARRLFDGEQGYIYHFTVEHGNSTLIEGRASIFIKATL